MLPLKDRNPTTRTPWVTIGLIAANAIIFLFWQPTFASGQVGELKQQFFFYCHAEVPWELTHQTNLVAGGAGAREALAEAETSIPPRIVQRTLEEGAHGTTPSGQRVDIDGCPDKSWWLSIFVAMFLHGGWLHIGGNMLFLWIFGNNVEDKIGPIYYLLFYLFGGIVATVAQVAIDPSSAIPNLGASGAIAAVLGAYLVMFPRRRVLTLIFFFFILFVELPAVVLLGFWFLLQLFQGVGSLGTDVNGGVAFFAHVGGFIAGLVIAWLFFPKERRPPPELYQPTY